MASVVAGHALHSGAYSRVRLVREDGPLRFRRGRATIPARVENVADTRRATTLAAEGARVSLVEHLLAALHIAGFWQGVLIEVEADELPILDGSSAPWLEAARELGAPPPPPAALALASALEHRAGDTLLRLTPGERELCVTVAYDHPAIGHQRWSGGPERYAELADARTFGFLREAEALRRAGLAKRADLENAIVFADEGPLAPLRHADEPVRHKALDALGDLALLGRPLAGRLEVMRGSHASHVAFLREVLAAANAEDAV